MTKSSPYAAALNAGEWSPLLGGRTDLQGYSAAAYTLDNFIPTIQGPITRRPGTSFIRQVKDSADRTWLVPFVRSRSISYMLEFGDGYVRFYTDRAPVLSGASQNISTVSLASPVVLGVTGHGYSNGQDVFVSGVGGATELNGRWFKVANALTNSFELNTIHGDPVDGSAYTNYTSGGTADIPYEISSPWSAADLITADGEFGLDVVQTGDVLYIATRNGTETLWSLSRTSATSWAFAAISFLDGTSNGPYEDLNSTAVTIYASAATGGAVTLTASASIFDSSFDDRVIRLDEEVVTATDKWAASTSYTTGDHVRSNGHEYVAATTATSGSDAPSHTRGTVTDGGVEWTYVSSGYGIALITAVAGTTATAYVSTYFPFPQTVVGSGNATTLWRRHAFSPSDGHPEVVSFFRERLVLGKGQKLYLSKAADFESFDIDEFGEILPESSVTIGVQSSETNDIVGLSESDVLTVFTKGAEFVLDAPDQSSPFGPGNVRMSKQAAYGSAEVRPVRVGNTSLFIQSSGKRLRSAQYSYDSGGLVAPDMNVRAPHISSDGLAVMTRQGEPWQTVWLCRKDGRLLSFAYDPDQEVRAWATHTLGGSSVVVESAAVIPSPDGTRDDLWLIVSRTINGATRRYIEVVSDEYQTGDDVSSAKYGDSLLSYSGAAATVLYGFDHLEGEAVSILSDGASAPDVTVANGEVALSSAAQVAQVGLPYSSRYASLPLEAATREGTSQGKTKRISDCGFRVIDTLGGKAGPDESSLDSIPDLTYRSPSTPMGSGQPLVTGVVFLSWPSGYEVDAKIWYVNDTMFPATIVSTMPQVDVSEDR